jgi:hypothetical protein
MPPPRTLLLPLPQRTKVTVYGVRVSRVQQPVWQVARMMSSGAAVLDSSELVQKVRRERHDSRIRKATRL